MATLSNPRDAWHNFGFVYGKSGVSRGTTTSSAVFAIDTLFSRQVVFAVAYDEALATRTVDMSLGNSQGTFFTFQPITPSGSTARFRVRRDSTATYTTRVSTSLEKSQKTFATATTGVIARWLAFGY